MGLVEKKQLVARLSPPLDALLAAQLLDEFVSIERRYIQRDWEPAELDGGQFCEVLGRLLYQADSGMVNRAKDLQQCLKYIDNDQVPHAISPRHDAIHLAGVVGLVYKFRSQRGAVHISPNYSPNHMDSKLIVENVRWCMMECLRVLGQGDREGIARAIRELLQFDVPCIGSYEGALLVQRTDLTAREEVMVLLHYAGEEGMTRADLGRFAQFSPPAITNAIQSLCSAKVRQAIKLSSGRIRLTDLGAKFLREQLADKLLLH